MNHTELGLSIFSCRSQMAFRDGLAVAVQAVVVGMFYFSTEASKLPDFEVLDD